MNKPVLFIYRKEGGRQSGQSKISYSKWKDKSYNEEEKLEYGELEEVMSLFKHN